MAKPAPPSASQKRILVLRRQIAAAEADIRALAAAEAERLARKAARSSAVRSLETGVPLRILAEGDSWFYYPAQCAGSVISRLVNDFDLPVKSLATAGDTVGNMLGDVQRERLIEELRSAVEAGTPWDALLFSGGGNDMVAGGFASCLRPFKAGATAKSLLDMSELDSRLRPIMDGYAKLVAIRDKHSPQTLLVLHGYEFAVPDGRGVVWLEPWLKPCFDARGFPAPDANGPPYESVAAAIVKLMLQRFKAGLDKLAAAKPGIVVVPTQGVFAFPDIATFKATWDNEMHLTGDGFRTVAKLFHDQLKAAFPGRVL